MAPKRAGGTISGSQSKRRGGVNSTGVKCSEVAASLATGGAEGDTASLSESVRQMLAGLVDFSLGVFKADRHPFQVEVVDMVGKAMNEIETGLEGEVAEARTKADGAMTDRAERENASGQAQENLEALKAAAAEKQNVSDAEDQAVADAETALSNAKKAQVNCDKRLKKAADDLEKLSSAKGDASTLVQEVLPAGPTGKKLLSNLVAMGKQNSFDESLLRALPTAAKKAPDVRGTFDVTAIQQIQNQFAKVFAEVEGMLAEADAKKEECRNVVVGAQAALEVALEKRNVANVAFEEAHAEVARGNHAVRDARKAASRWLPDTKEVMDLLDEKVKELETFRKGPLAMYAELQELAPPPPVPEEPASPNAAPESTGPASAEAVAAEPTMASTEAAAQSDVVLTPSPA